MCRYGSCCVCSWCVKRCGPAVFAVGVCRGVGPAVFAAGVCRGVVLLCL